MVEVDVLVIGAGAGGIIAAWRAASLGARTMLVEKTPRIGTKILISGGGKCNIVHDGDMADVLRAFRPAEASFLRPSVYRFPNREVLRLFTDRGLRVVTRPDGRIFPESATAKEVVAILADHLREAGVDLRLNSAVSGLIVENGAVVGAHVVAQRSPGQPKFSPPAAEFGAKALLRNALSITDDADAIDGTIRSSAVVIATGGSSYPNSGTTGDGWIWMRELGHSVSKLRAALSPLYLELHDSGLASPALSGTALRDVELIAQKNSGKLIERWAGDILFTHHGVSGPPVLGVSRRVAEELESGSVEAVADCVPELSREDVDAFLLDRSNSGRPVLALIREFLPERVAEVLLARLQILPEKSAGQLTKPERKSLVSKVKALPLGRVRTVPLEKGEVVAGGVALGEVDERTMASRVLRGLFLCGEILDVAGPVGGYNLQAAFSTGFVAGESAARSLHSEI